MGTVAAQDIFQSKLDSIFIGRNFLEFMEKGMSNNLTLNSEKAPLSALTHQAMDYKPGKVHFENFNRLKVEISNM